MPEKTTHELESIISRPRFLREIAREAKKRGELHLILPPVMRHLAVPASDSPLREARTLCWIWTEDNLPDGSLLRELRWLGYDLIVQSRTLEEISKALPDYVATYLPEARDLPIKIFPSLKERISYVRQIAS
ncbi:hypothetical protein HYW40_02645 [Candidatus Curtissbacteria bacterium]|nr:hypothetical protein [Candidatus Curtissbacteria bacterium]